MTLGSPFDPSVPSIAWDGDDTGWMANPEWVRRHPSTMAASESALPALRAHLWVATSGSSAGSADAVRWVALSKAAFLVAARAVNEHLEATSADTWAHALPMFHVGGLGILARAWLVGARVVPAVLGRWDPVVYHRQVADHHATLSALVPAQVHDLVVSGLSAPPSLRAVVVGGARLDPTLHRRARRLGWPCLASYGLTETCAQVATSSIESLAGEEPPTLLPILPHAEVRATDTGVLEIRAASLLTCVAELDGGRAHVFDPKHDGWLTTDDLGRVTGRRLEVFGRASESVKVRGELVSLARVEAAIQRWADADVRGDAGRDRAVAALPHPRLGHELVLAIVPRSGAAMDGGERARVAASVAAFCRAALLPFERIERVVWVDRIPRTPLGKCQRQLLALEMLQQPAADL